VKVKSHPAGTLKQAYCFLSCFAGTRELTHLVEGLICSCLLDLEPIICILMTPFRMHFQDLHQDKDVIKFVTPTVPITKQLGCEVQPSSIPA
jgi:hypothetical protein